MYLIYCRLSCWYWVFPELWVSEMLIGHDVRSGACDTGGDKCDGGRGDRLQSCRPHIDRESPGGVGSILDQQHGQSALLCHLVFTWSISTVYTVSALIWANVTSLYDLILFYLTLVKHVKGYCHTLQKRVCLRIEISWLRKCCWTLPSLLPRKNMLIWGECDLICVCVGFYLKYYSNVYKKDYLRGIIH